MNLTLNIVTTDFTSESSLPITAGGISINGDVNPMDSDTHTVVVTDSSSAEIQIVQAGYHFYTMTVDNVGNGNCVVSVNGVSQSVPLTAGKKTEVEVSLSGGSVTFMSVDQDSSDDPGPGATVAGEIEDDGNSVAAADSISEDGVSEDGVSEDGESDAASDDDSADQEDEESEDDSDATSDDDSSKSESNA